MTAPMLPANIALATVRDDLVFTKTRLSADPTAASHAKTIVSLLGDGEKIQLQQLELWDAQTQADAHIATADDGLDDYVVVFAGLIRALPGGEKSAQWGTYFKTPPHLLAAPILGDELDALRRWQKFLAKEKAATLAATKKRLDKLIDAADAALKARDQANATNEHFRTRGELSAYLSTVGKKRDAVAAALDANAASDANLPRGYSSRFFRRRTVKMTAEVKQARAAKKEADRAARVAAEASVKAAQDKVKAAIQELRAAQRIK